MVEVCLLGATGSIGGQVLDVMREKRDYYRLCSFSFGHNVNLALDICEEFEPNLVCAQLEEDAKIILEKFPHIIVVFGNSGLQQVACYPSKNPMVINALVGSVGLTPTLSAIDNGRNVYLANKETLVIGGELVMKRAKEKKVRIIPIDSEHSAIAQILEGKDKSEIKQLYITASGGAFRDLSREELDNVTAADALKHPNWKMGAKITIDCATMMNKGFELIEAHYLFDLPIDMITPILHRESVVHSMVEFKDCSIFAQMGSSDMHLPIKYAMEGPSHSASSCIEPLDLSKMLTLHFEPLSLERYPMIEYAKEAIAKGSIYPTVLNAANEIGVKYFLEGKIKFLDIEKMVVEALHDEAYAPFAEGELTVPKIISVDELVRIKLMSKYRQ